MPEGDARFRSLIAAAAEGDAKAVSALLKRDPGLARRKAPKGATRQNAKAFFLKPIRHYLMQGDTALHIAAAAQRPAVVRLLLKAGAKHSAKNRLGQRPLHYAADGGPGFPHQNPRAQASCIALLAEAGAWINSRNRLGTTALHRAVRNRCASAVKALLEHGARPGKKTKGGSTPLALALQATGRGGSGSAEAKRQQHKIILLLSLHKARP